MSGVRIAHISDLHLSADHKRMNIRNTKRLLDRIKRLNIDHVVITGDIAANADADDFHIARNLFHSAGLLDGRRMSVVIGNHDVYGGVHTPEDILDFPRRCKKVDVRKKVDSFTEHFQELFRNSYFLNEEFPFPYFKLIGDVLLIGLCSVAGYSAMKNPVGSNGLVDERQQQELDRTLSSGQFDRSRTLVLVHHHFKKMEHETDGTMQSVWEAFEQQTMKLRGKKELMLLFKKHRVDAVLHGHVHENSEYTRKGLRFINGGGSILGARPSILRLNVLHVSPTGVHLEQHEVPAVEEIRRARVARQTPPLLPSHAAA
jgi:3',5'-cyclic AMP phosphodiesterase CpdA